MRFDARRVWSKQACRAADTRVATTSAFGRKMPFPAGGSIGSSARFRGREQPNTRVT